MAWHRASKSTAAAGSPLMLKPVVGFCWWPVMPVMELSSTMTTELAAVVGDIYQAGNAGVDKGGIADDSHAFLRRLGAAGLVVAVESRHRRAHADGGVHGVEGARMAPRV